MPAYISRPLGAYKQSRPREVFKPSGLNSAEVYLLENKSQCGIQVSKLNTCPAPKPKALAYWNRAEEFNFINYDD